MSTAGTASTGLGVGIRTALRSTTTSNQDAGRLTWEWDVATDASRASRGKLSAYYTSTERVCIDWKAGSAAPLIGVLGAAPALRQVVTGSKASGAALVSLLAALVTFGWITDSTTA